MVQRTLYRVMAFILLAFVACSCKADKIVGAAKDFIAFSEGQDRVMDPLSHATSGFQIRRWKGNHIGTRYRAVVDIEVDSAIPAGKLHKLISDAIHSPQIMREASAVMVRAWPGKLEKMAAPLGVGIFARDGHGWDGKGVGFEQIFVFQPTKDQMNQKDIRPISEAEYYRVLGVEKAMDRGKDLKTAQKDVAEFQSVSVDDVSAACLHAAKIAQWYRHRATKSGLTAALGVTK